MKTKKAIDQEITKLWETIDKAKPEQLLNAIMFTMIAVVSLDWAKGLTNKPPSQFLADALGKSEKGKLIEDIKSYPKMKID